MAAQQHAAEYLLSSSAKNRASEYSFYAWRKWLQESGRYGLRWWRGAERQERTTEPARELVLATGERLRIGSGVDITNVLTTAPTQATTTGCNFAFAIRSTSACRALQKAGWYVV